MDVADHGNMDRVILLENLSEAAGPTAAPGAVGPLDQDFGDVGLAGTVEKFQSVPSRGRKGTQSHDISRRSFDGSARS